MTSCWPLRGQIVGELVETTIGTHARVEPDLYRKIGDRGVGDRLRDHDGAGGEPARGPWPATCVVRG